MFEKFKSPINHYQTKQIKKLKKQLEIANSYDEWKGIATALDRETGLEEWKYDNRSPFFDASLISYRYNLLKKYRAQGRTQDLIYVLREGLSYDIANIGHPMLYAHTYVGTKKIIEDYINEVSQCLFYIASSECTLFKQAEKIQFFERCKTVYGQPTLMFSGGATLGLFHTGVCKALIEQNLMPSVLSGSSAGAIMAGMLGTSYDYEIPEILSGNKFFSKAFHFRSLKELIKGNGGFADVQYLKNFLIENLGNYTFAEAYEKSGLDINVTVAPYNGSQEPRILNALTSPNVLVWSAVLASCAVPVLFPPVRLTSKRYDGELTAYMARTKWVDGSVRSDFPQEKMARLYNINYSIACQVNPHVVPFMQSDVERYRSDVLSWPERIVRQQAKIVALTAMDFTRERIGEFGTLRRLLDHGYGVLGQRYYGDVNIIGKYNLKHYTYMLQNPRPELFQLLQKEGERATWPKISTIETHARIGKSIENCLMLLTEKQQTQKKQKIDV